MRYSEIEQMCRPDRRFLKPWQTMRGCPHDGLGCTGGKVCSINSDDPATAQRAYNAGIYGPHFVCAKRIFPNHGAEPEAAKVRTPR